MPVFSSDDVLKRHAALCQFREQVLRDGVDFGVIPGTGVKPTLLKPGAEKLCTLFGLTTRFEIVERVEDWTGATHGGEPFFYYLYRASLWRSGNLIAESDGSCNSRETKYRYRKGERVCPSCGVAAIINGKAEYGGGYICFAKKGGCGAKFPKGDSSIESQVVGKVPNADIADVVNTIQKMAQKRALVAVTLIGVNASEFFTQDIEDFAHHDMDISPPVETPPAPKYEVVDNIAELSNADLRMWCDFVVKNATDHPQKEQFKAEFQKRVDARKAKQSESEIPEGEVVALRHVDRWAALNETAQKFKGYLTFVAACEKAHMPWASDRAIKAFEDVATSRSNMAVVADDLINEDWNEFATMVAEGFLSWSVES